MHVHTSRLTRVAAYFVEILVLFSPLLSSEGPKQLTRQLVRVSDVKSNGRLHTCIHAYKRAHEEGGRKVGRRERWGGEGGGKEGEVREEREVREVMKLREVKEEEGAAQ